MNLKKNSKINATTTLDVPPEGNPRLLRPTKHLILVPDRTPEPTFLQQQTRQNKVRRASVVFRINIRFII